MSYDALRQHNEASSQAKIDAGLAAIQRFVAAGTPLSVSDVCREAGISRSFLYRHATLKRTYDAAVQGQSTPATEPASTARLRAENARLRERLRASESKVAELQRQLRRQWGGAIEDVPNAELTQRIADLEARGIVLQQENQELRVGAADQDAVIEQLQERLDAQRQLRREQMKASNLS